MFFMMGVLGIFAPPLFSHVDRARACAQPAPAHRRARQRAQVQLFHHTTRGGDTTTSSQQPRHCQHRRDHRPPRSNRMHAMRARARRQPTERFPMRAQAFRFHLAPVQPARLIGHLLLSEPARRTRLDRAPRASAHVRHRQVGRCARRRRCAVLRAPLFTRGSGQ